MATADSSKPSFSKPLPPVEYLRECFVYDRDAGTLTWKERPLSHFPSPSIWKMWNTKFAHQIGGHRHASGYLHIRINKRNIMAHRIIYKLMTGDEPPELLDHKNGIRSDNHWDNIRVATSQQNQWNSGIQRNNTIGLKGVIFMRRRKKFKAQIGMNGKKVYLGYFPTVEQAHAAYCAAACAIHGEFYNGDELKRQ